MIYCGMESYIFFKSLFIIVYKLKGVGKPTYHLGGDFKRISEKRLLWVSSTYVEIMIDGYKSIFNE